MQRREPGDHGGIRWSDVAQGKGHLQPPEARRAGKDSSLEPSEEAWA